MKITKWAVNAAALAAFTTLFFTAAAGSRAQDAESAGGGGNAGKRDIRIVVPYLGAIADKNEDLDRTDSSLMKGLYLQWVRPDVFQCNFFIYQSSDINYSTIWGGHFIFDYYFDVAERHRNVIGAGFDFISIDTDAGSNIAGLSDFTLLNTISAPYVRAGRYFLFGSKSSAGRGMGGFDISVLPWLGFEYDFVNGSLSLDPVGPAPPQESKINDRYVFPLLGLNVKATLFHFLEGEAKYTARFDADDYFHDVSTLVNVYFARHWGISYRFKYMENVSGWISYHIVGIAAVF